MQVQPNSTRVQAPETVSQVADVSSVNSEQNDGTSSNPIGRDTLDDRREKTTLLKSRKPRKIAVMNVRTIRQKSQQIELASNASKHNIELLGVVDHKICHDNEEELEYHQLDQHILITSSAWRNSSNAASGGVGILVSKTVESALAEVQRWNERILIAHFTGNPSTTVIIHYAPVEGKSDAEEHYKNLTAAAASIPKHNILLVVGDFNAHIGKDHGKYTFHNETNKNGQLAIDFAEEVNLLVTNTHFRKKRGKLWTHISDMSGSKTQIDYIMIRRKWKNSVKNSEVYSSFSSVGSDHRIVTATIKLSLRVTKQPPRGNMYDWSALCVSDMQQQYTVQVRNRYEQLCDEGQNVTETYDHFIKANEETSLKLLPKRTSRKKTNKTSTDIRVTEARERVNNAFSAFTQSPSQENNETLQREKQALKDEYATVESEELEQQINHVETANAESQHSLSWKLINEITGRRNTKQGIIKGTSREERIEKWHNHFQKLLGEEPVISSSNIEDTVTVFNDLNISDEPFTQEEYKAVKNKLVDGKSAGPDGIPPEVFKHCNFDDIMLHYANNVIDNTEKPDQWSLSHLKPLPKSGDLSNVGNYRGISLSVIAAKITNKLLLNRIQPILNPLLRPNQNGFRPGRSTTAHVLALRRLIEGVKSNNLKAIITFVDFKKAFDSIHRGKMFDILRAYGIPEKIVQAISCIYENTKAKVITPDGETETFDILAGVLQGDTLAPFLFIIVLDYVMRQAIDGKEAELGFEITRRKSRRIPPVIITDLSFADDVALVSEEIEQAQGLLTRVEKEAANVGLHINVKKTELMAYNYNNAVELKTSCGQNVKNVENFKYLGSWMQNPEKDFDIRKAMAWSACHKMKKIWQSSLERDLKIRLFKSTVESVLLYGCQTWTVNKVLEKRINGCYTRMLRMVLNVSWQQKLTNKQLYKELPTLSQIVQERRLNLAGHCVRHPEEIAHQLVLWTPTQGKKKRGRRAITFIDNLKEDTDLENTDEIRTLMENRVVWRKIAKSGRAGARP